MPLTLYWTIFIIRSEFFRNEQYKHFGLFCFGSCLEISFATETFLFKFFYVIIIIQPETRSESSFIWYKHLRERTKGPVLETQYQSVRVGLWTCLRELIDVINITFSAGNLHFSTLGCSIWWSDCTHDLNHSLKYDHTFLVYNGVLVSIRLCQWFRSRP